MNGESLADFELCYAPEARGGVFGWRVGRMETFAGARFYVEVLGRRDLAWDSASKARWVLAEVNDGELQRATIRFADGVATSVVSGSWPGGVVVEFVAEIVPKPVRSIRPNEPDAQRDAAARTLTITEAGTEEPAVYQVSEEEWERMWAKPGEGSAIPGMRRLVGAEREEAEARFRNAAAVAAMTAQPNGGTVPAPTADGSLTMEFKTADQDGYPDAPWRPTVKGGAYPELPELKERRVTIEVSADFKAPSAAERSVKIGDTFEFKVPSRTDWERMWAGANVAGRADKLAEMLAPVAVAPIETRAPDPRRDVVDNWLATRESVIRDLSNEQRGAVADRIAARITSGSRFGKSSASMVFVEAETLAGQTTLPGVELQVFDESTPAPELSWELSWPARVRVRLGDARDYAADAVRDAFEWIERAADWTWDALGLPSRGDRVEWFDRETRRYEAWCAARARLGMRRRPRDLAWDFLMWWRYGEDLASTYRTAVGSVYGNAVNEYAKGLEEIAKAAGLPRVWITGEGLEPPRVQADPTKPAVFVVGSEGARWTFTVAPGSGSKYQLGQEVLDLEGNASRVVAIDADPLGDRITTARLPGLGIADAQRRTTFSVGGAIRGRKPGDKPPAIVYDALRVRAIALPEE